MRYGSPSWSFEPGGSVSRKVRRWWALALGVLVATSVASPAVATERDDGGAVHRHIARALSDPTTPSRPLDATWRTDRATRAASPSTSYGFDAIARDGSNWRAHPTGSMGEHWILTAANASYALYDLSGDTIIGPNALSSLRMLPSGATASDPRIVYDQYDGRFVLTYVAVDDANRRSWIYVLSIPDATATEPSTWCLTKVVADRTGGDGPQRPRDTGLGYDETRVAVSADMYDFGRDRFSGSTVLAFPKARLYDCSRTPRYDTFTGRETLSRTGERAVTLQPAVTVGHGRSLYLTSLEPGRSSFVTLWRLSGELGSMTLRSVPLHVPRVRHPPAGTQGGATPADDESRWITGDAAITSTFSDLDTGRVYAAHAAARNLRPDPSGDDVESTIRWYEIEPAGALGASRVLRVGTIGTPQTDAGWPSLATDDTGNLFVTYSRASAVTGEFLSAWIAEVVPGSTDATTQPLRIGTARFEATAGHEPWGDSSAMSRDPVDGRFVMAVNQVAVSDGSGATRDWREIVQVVSHGP
jgi:hypothetical protein